jgi:predicted secreted Zn-dependent protease
MFAQKSTRKDGDYTYVVQPKIAVNTRITKFMQVQAYGSYRITGNTNSQYYQEKNYNGPSAGVSLVFGGF